MVYANEVIALLSSLSRHLITYIKVYVKVNRRFVIIMVLDTIGPNDVIHCVT